MVFVFTTTAPSGCSTLWKLTNSWNRATWWSIVKRDSRQNSATFFRHPSPSRSTVSLLCVLPPCPFFKQEKYLFFSARFFSVSPDLREGFFFVFFSRFLTRRFFPFRFSWFRVIAALAVIFVCERVFPPKRCRVGMFSCVRIFPFVSLCLSSGVESDLFIFFVLSINAEKN